MRTGKDTLISQRTVESKRGMRPPNLRPKLAWGPTLAPSRHFPTRRRAGLAPDSSQAAASVSTAKITSWHAKLSVWMNSPAELKISSELWVLHPRQIQIGRTRFIDLLICRNCALVMPGRAGWVTPPRFLRSTNGREMTSVVLHAEVLIHSSRFG
jgi:hypothetical protein